MIRVKRRIAFFGGTFDPVHNGHLAMAEAAADALQLHRVYFVPAGQNPFKGEGANAPASDRLEMLRLAIGNHPRFSIWEGELGRSGPSYTIDSVEHIERVYPNSHLFWIIGSDQLAKLGQWHRIRKLVLKIGFILVQRPGFPITWPGVPGLRVYCAHNLPMEVSSTEIRQRLHDGKPLSGLVPPDVETYICRIGLYRSPGPAASG